MFGWLITFRKHFWIDLDPSLVFKEANKNVSDSLISLQYFIYITSLSEPSYVCLLRSKSNRVTLRWICIGQALFLGIWTSSQTSVHRIALPSLVELNQCHCSCFPYCKVLRLSIQIVTVHCRRELIFTFSSAWKHNKEWNCSHSCIHSPQVETCQTPGKLTLL